MPIWIEAIGAVGLLFVGLGYAWGQFRDGNNKSTIDDQQKKLNANSLLQQQVDALETTVEDLKQQINEQTIKIDTLTADIKLRDTKFAETILALQGKDPQMAEFFATMKAYTTANIPLLETIKTSVIPTVDRLGKYLDKQSF